MSAEFSIQKLNAGKPVFCDGDVLRVTSPNAEGHFDVRIHDGGTSVSLVFYSKVTCEPDSRMFLTLPGLADFGAALTKIAENTMEEF